MMLSDRNSIYVCGVLTLFLSMSEPIESQSIES